MNDVDAYPMALHVGEIFVDHSYQRICDVTRARAMSATWDRRLAGIVEVSDRGETATPRYAVIDGQHRWAAAGFLQDPPTLVANVHEGLTIADEAALFDKLNRQRKQPSPWDHWRARRTSGDPTVLAIEGAAAAQGFEVTDRVRDGSLCCISTLEKITASAGGLDLLRSVLTVLAGAYGDQHSAYEAPIVHGLAMTLYAFAERVDANRMIAALSEIPPQRIRLHASTMRDGGTPGSLAKLTAAAIANQYNRSGASGRLNWPPSWKGVLPKPTREPRTAATLQHERATANKPQTPPNTTSGTHLRTTHRTRRRHRLPPRARPTLQRGRRSDRPGRRRAPRRGLLLGRDQHPPRHHPPSRTTTIRPNTHRRHHRTRCLTHGRPSHPPSSRQGRRRSLTAAPAAAGT